MKTLTELADHYGSDKGLTIEQGHGYTLLYEDLLEPFRLKEITFLEIGLKKGGPECGGTSWAYRGDSPSVEMWLEYFPKIDLVGFDISDFSSQQKKHEKFAFLMGDLGNSEDLKKLSSLRDYYDIILDDASHASDHQQMALSFLWDKIPSGGLYIIEDLHWQPWAHDAIPKTLDLFHNYFNKEKDYKYSPLISRELIDKIYTEAAYMLLHQSPKSGGQTLILKKI